MNPIVVLTHNCVNLTRQCLPTLLNQDIGKVDILVMDDGSTDGTIQYLASQHPKIRSCHYSAKGVSYLWNKALSHFFGDLRASYVWVVNNDTRQRPDAYRRLVSDQGGFITCVGTSSGAQFPGGEPSGEKRPHPDFSCFLIRREVWERIGGFDERMAIYCSDGDFHLRMYQAKINAYCLDLPFYHEASGTMKNTSNEDRDRIQAIADRDRRAFREKWECDMGSAEYYKLFEEAR